MIALAEGVERLLATVVIPDFDAAVTSANEIDGELGLVVVVLYDDFLVRQVERGVKRNYDRAQEGVSSLLVVNSDLIDGGAEDDRFCIFIFVKVRIFRHYNYLLCLLDDLVVVLEHTFEHLATDA